MKPRFTRSYFSQIWILFLAAIVISITVLAFVLTRTFETANILTVNSLNQEVLKETRRVNEYVRRMLRVSGMELFFEPSVQRLMNQATLSNFEVLTGLRRLDSVQSMGTHIHSIYVYNPTQSYIYSSSNRRSGPLEDFYDKGVDNLLFSDRGPTRLVPIPRVLRYRDGEIPLYSFVYYDPMNFHGPVEGALIINVTLDWLGEVLGFREDPSPVQFFVNRLGLIVYHPDSARFLEDVSAEPFIRTIMSSGHEAGYFVDGYGNERVLVTYTQSDDGDLYLVRQVPYQHFMRPLWVLRARVLALVAIFLAVGSTMAFFFSRRIYRPIGDLVTSLSPLEEDPLDGTGGLTDLEYLSTRIGNMIEETTNLERTSEAYRAKLRIEILKELLHGDLIMVPDSETAQLFQLHDIRFNASGVFYLALLRGGQVSHDVSMEVETGLVDLDMGDHLVLLWQSDGDLTGDVYRRSGAETLIRSGMIQGASGLATAYEDMLDLYHKVTLFGNRGVFSVVEYMRNDLEFSYPTEQEKRLIHCLKAADGAACVEQFEVFLDAISVYRYEQVRFSLRRLYVSIQFEVKEMQTQGYFTGSSDFCMHEFETQLRSIRDRRQLTDIFTDLFTDFQEEIQRHRQERIAILATQIDGIVEDEYTNINLSPVLIAERVGLSAPYLCRIYKEVRSRSLSEHILIRRIEEAKRLLHLEQSLPAREIASRVGFTNENYFYTVFRKCAGMTPNTFRKQVLVSHRL